MKKFFLGSLLATVLLITTAFTIQSIINWKIDNDHSQVKFTLQAHGQALTGGFKGIDGTVKFDSTDLASSSFNCSINVATIYTGNEMRDEHLQDKEWFSASEFPVINFTSSAIVSAAEGYKAVGTLSSKGITKNIDIPFTFSDEGAAGTFKGAFTISRTDFGIGIMDAEVGDTVLIELDVPVSKAE